MGSISFIEFAQLVQDMRIMQNKARAVPREDKKTKNFWMMRAGTKVRDVDAMLKIILGGQAELFATHEPIEDTVIEFEPDMDIPF